MFAAHPQIRRRLSALACAATLAVMLTSGAAASRLERDDAGKVALVTPKSNPVNVSRQWMTFKLATTAGRNVLIYG